MQELSFSEKEQIYGELMGVFQKSQNREKPNLDFSLLSLHLSRELRDKIQKLFNNSKNILIFSGELNKLFSVSEKKSQETKNSSFELNEIKDALILKGFVDTKNWEMLEHLIQAILDTDHAKKTGVGSLAGSNPQEFYYRKLTEIIWLLQSKDINLKKIYSALEDAYQIKNTNFQEHYSIYQEKIYQQEKKELLTLLPDLISTINSDDFTGFVNQLNAVLSFLDNAHLKDLFFRNDKQRLTEFNAIKKSLPQSLLTIFSLITEARNNNNLSALKKSLKEKSENLFNCLFGD